MNNRYWRDLIASSDHGLWRGALPVTAKENFFFDIVMRLAKKEEDDEKLEKLLAARPGAELRWRTESVAPSQIRAANKLAGQRKGGEVTGERRTTVRRIRRILIEELLFGPQKEGGMPDDERRHPLGEDTIKWLRDFFKRLAKAELAHPLKGTSADTLEQDIKGVLAKRRKLN